MRGMSFVDPDGTEVYSSTDLTLTGGPLDSADVEILRDDLSGLLAGVTANVEYRYGDAITGIRQDAGDVRVTFEHGSPRTFDLVVGADGLWSGVRLLAFDPGDVELNHLGSHIAVFTMPNTFGLDRWQVFCQAPGKMAGVYTARDNAEVRVTMGFDGPDLAYDHRDVVRQKELLAAAFAGDGWWVPAMLDGMADAKDFYFAPMTQVRMPRWSTGRVALIGDAGYCATPLSGQGTSLAMVGAYVLAGELGRADGDHAVAFAAYERRMRDFVAANQRLALVNADRVRDLADGQPIAEHWVESAATAISLERY